MATVIEARGLMFPNEAIFVSDTPCLKLASHQTTPDQQMATTCRVQ
jgi:hypothetical protein